MNRVPYAGFGVVVLLLGLAGWWWLGVGGAPVGGAAPASALGERVAESGALREAVSSKAATVPIDRQLTSAGKSSVRGRLLQSGRPLVGIVVIAGEGSAWQAKEVDRAVTDERGEFVLLHLENRYWLTARGDGVPRFWKTGWRSPERNLGDLAVEAPGAIEGVVRNREGAPVPNAEITWMVDSYKRVQLADAASAACTTDVVGRFRLDGLSSGLLTLYCASDHHTHLPDHLVKVAAGKTVVTEIVLHKGRTLRGTVLDHRDQALAGAKVWRSRGKSTSTDDLGRFELQHHAFGSAVKISAPGHLAHDARWSSAGKQLRVQLERAVTLRASVFGTNGLPGSVYLEHVSNARADASHRMAAGKFYEWLDIVRDERFELDGLPMSDFEVTVRVPGVGRVGPIRIEMRDDMEITLAVDPQRQVAISVRDDLGEEVEGGVLIRDEGILRYPRTYEEPVDKLLRRIRRSRRKLAPMPLAAGGGSLGVPKGEGLAFLIDAPGHLSFAKSVMPDAMPERIEVVLVRSGSLRGRVTGGDRDAYATSVAVYEAEHVSAQVVSKPVASVGVDNNGAFLFEKLRPGPYRVLVRRANTANSGKDSVGVPLVDSSDVAASQAECVVRAGESAELELVEPKLGRLTGRVTLRGVPLPGAVIAVSRASADGPASEAQVQAVSPWRDRGKDWDGEITLQHAAGQRTKADGSFTILYATAGLVEVRLRHPDGHVTSAAIRVQLPPPGEDVVRELEMPVGEIRGRIPLEQLDARMRERVQVTLFPANKVHHDPFYSEGDVIPIQMNCATIDKPDDGAFAFSFLRSGTWLVRIHEGYFSRRVLWQDVVDVHADVVDLGGLAIVPAVPAVLSWKWQGKPAGKVRGVWLRRARASGPSVWAATCAANSDTAHCQLAPGRYEVNPFGWPGVDNDMLGGGGIGGVGGDAFADAVTVVIRPDGTVEPQQLLFVARPIPEAGGRDK